MKYNYLQGLFSFIIISLFSFHATSQEVKMERAEREYERLGFVRASEVYEKVAKKGYRSKELFKKLGNTYYFNADYKNALRWYEELYKFDSILLPIYYMRYSQCLNAVGKNEKSAEMFNKYRQEVNNSKVGELSVEDYINIIGENSGRYDIKILDVNTNGVDFGGYSHDGILLFSSTRDTGSVFKRISAWDGLSFLDLYQSDVNEEGKPKVVSLKGDVNTGFHESSGCMTKDGRTLYFTRNNTTNSNNQKEKVKVQHLKVYRATLINGKWKNIEDLSINGDNYSTAHPVLSPLEDKLYFVSDRPESIGATDIFYAKINPNGGLGRVENLGEKVNTRGRESFPFVSERNELYFSSDGHFGLGGYDVFYTQIYGNSTGSIVNVGKPVNSKMDDFAFSIDPFTHEGFISSNRPGGMGKDDIYRLYETKDIRSVIKARIYGRVTDQLSGQPIENCTIKVYDEDRMVYAPVMTDADGNYSIESDRYASYRIVAFHNEYNADEAYSIVGKEMQEINFILERDLFLLRKGVNLSKVLNINKIYFDYDQYMIRSDSEFQLQKILTFLNDYPQLNIEIHSHTDSRGSDAYNLILSKRRALSAKKYLTDRGVDSKRLSITEHGESQPVNKCVNGVKCSEAEYEMNRRIDFIISKGNL